MPLPSVYTESTLLAFMEAELGPLVAQLGLDSSDGLSEAVNEVIGILGNPLADETSNAEIVKVRAIARWQAWVAAQNAATASFDLKAGTVDLKLSQLFKQISTRLADALDAARIYSEVQDIAAGGGVAYASAISSSPDPYAWPACTEF